jgi:hypothetical protein
LGVAQRTLFDTPPRVIRVLDSNGGPSINNKYCAPAAGLQKMAQKSGATEGTAFADGMFV